MEHFKSLMSDYSHFPLECFLIPSFQGEEEIRNVSLYLGLALQAVVVTVSDRCFWEQSNQ